VSEPSESKKVEKPASNAVMDVRLQFLDGCMLAEDHESLKFDDEDFPCCPHGYRLYGWQSTSRGTHIDSSQLREARKSFRRHWSLRQQERVLQGRSRADAVRELWQQYPEGVGEPE
jgi:hypothetical protein